MENKDTQTEVERVLDGGGSGLANHYNVMARKVAEKYGSDSVEAVVAALYRDDIHGYITSEAIYIKWLEKRRKDLSNLAPEIRKAEQLLMLRKNLTLTNYASRAACNVFARRVLREDILIRLFDMYGPDDLEQEYTHMLRILHAPMHWNGSIAAVD